MNQQKNSQRYMRALNGLNQYFLYLKIKDIKQYSLKDLQQIKKRIQGKLTFNDCSKQLKKIYQCLKQASQGNANKSMNMDLSYDNIKQVLNIIKISKKKKYKQKPKIEQQQRKKDSIHMNFTGIQRSLNQLSIFNQIQRYQGIIIGGKLKLQLIVINEQTKKTLKIFFTINPMIKYSCISLENWIQLGNDIQNIKYKNTKEIFFNVIIEHRNHKVQLNQESNQLGSSFLEQNGVLIKVNYREHQRNFQLIITQ